MPETLSHTSTFSTEMLPERERFDQFLEEIARKLIGVEVERRGDAPYHTKMRSVGLGSIMCNAIEYSAASWGRSAELLSDGNDNFVFHVCEASPYHDSVRNQIVGVGQAVLHDNSRQCSLANDTGGSALVLLIPRKVLLQRVPDAEDLTRSGIVADRTELRLLRGYVATLLDSPPLSAATLNVAGQHVIDLLTLALGVSDKAVYDEANGGLRTARLLAVHQSIAARLHDPTLTLPEIAKSSSMSDRLVQRLFAQQGTSFSDYVLGQRLELAHRLLINPLNHNRRIVSIALESGFGDLSYFNRSFRQRFGDTPSGIRNRAVA